jgi:hypothetical protein
MIAAFTQWPEEGIPDNPRGWLIQVASRRLTDQVRGEIARRQRETAVANDVEATAHVDEIESDMDPDGTLILLFMCCHPALTSSSAIALTLRAVGGLTTAEIANAFGTSLTRRLEPDILCGGIVARVIDAGCRWRCEIPARKRSINAITGGTIRMAKALSPRLRRWRRRSAIASIAVCSNESPGPGARNRFERAVCSSSF